MKKLRFLIIGIVSPICVIWFGIALLEEVAADYAASGEDFAQARVLRNLALLYQKLGKISLANNAIAVR